MKRDELNLLREEGCEITSGVALSNVRPIEEASVFAEAGLKPDMWKAYVEFDICHSAPVVAGPTMSGDYTTLHPQVLAKSYGSLLHQQFNIRHMLKAYNPETIARDRIIGCIVGVKYPEKIGNWEIPESESDAPCIHAMAVVFKLAEGVGTLIGNHQTSRQRQAVSIEATYSLNDMGIYCPWDRSMYTWDDVPDEILAQVSLDKKTKRPKLGKFEGKQLVVAMGGRDGVVSFRGVGMTPTPAERQAKLTAVHAERGLLAVAAEAGQEMVKGLVGGFVGFGENGRISGKVIEAHMEGRVRVNGYVMQATEEDPVLVVQTPATNRVMVRLSRCVV